MRVAAAPTSCRTVPAAAPASLLADATPNSTTFDHRPWADVASGAACSPNRARPLQRCDTASQRVPPGNAGVN
ncbi:hypothetical protein A7D17_10530 [Xanthomonas floridensis]|uniref:Uncharacterized protein n=1 Tax=Xanthomonas floridensis TaxID=1843580 RepID=A0A1A9MFF7_9XANT|nr:hypothetical protein A7D17_10530 [Xanthomonas floridensis]